MLLSVISGAVGLLGSFVPEVFKTFQDRRDKAHELEIMKLQMTLKSQEHNERLDEIIMQAHAAEAVELQKSYQKELKYSGKYAASVRPTVTYLLVGEYFFVKLVSTVASIWSIMNPALPWQAHGDFMVALTTVLPLLWTEFDGAMLSGVVMFWFGGRAFERKR